MNVVRVVSLCSSATFIFISLYVGPSVFSMISFTNAILLLFYADFCKFCETKQENPTPKE